MTKNKIDTLHLYPLLDNELILLLKSLSSEDWHKQTICKLWSVKDIVAHILDGCYLRRLSICRDNFYGEEPEKIESYADIVNFLNRLNAEWVKAARQLSPQILISLIEEKSSEVVEYFKTLDLHAEAPFSVAWAGEEKSENWFDIARDYTERWLHQQQIRLAVNKPGIMNREFYNPLLEIFMRALPHTYRNIEAEEGTAIKITVTTEAGGDWYLKKSLAIWEMVEDHRTPHSTVVIPAEVAWRIFSKGIDKEVARDLIQVEGDRKLGENILNMTSVMA